jgi:hypothetical protein
MILDFFKVKITYVKKGYFWSHGEFTSLFTLAFASHYNSDGAGSLLAVA